MKSIKSTQQVGAGHQAAPSPSVRVTVQGELNALYDFLIITSEYVSRLEETLSPVTHDSRANGCDGESEPKPPQPEIVSSIQGLQASVRAHNARLESLLLRLAL